MFLYTSHKQSKTDSVKRNTTKYDTKKQEGEVCHHRPHSPTTELWLRGLEANSSSQRNEFHFQWSVLKVRPRGTFKTVEAVLKGNPQEMVEFLDTQDQP